MNLYVFVLIHKANASLGSGGDYRKFVFWLVIIICFTFLLVTFITYQHVTFYSMTII